MPSGQEDKYLNREEGKTYSKGRYCRYIWYRKKL